MKTLTAISMWQPWASLLVHGEKTIETRSWRLPVPFPRLLAVHAAKRWTLEQRQLRGDPLFSESLNDMLFAPAELEDE